LKAKADELKAKADELAKKDTSIADLMASIERRIIDICNIPAASLSKISEIDYGRVLELSKQLLSYQKGKFDTSKASIDGRWTVIFKEDPSGPWALGTLEYATQFIKSSIGKYEDQAFYSVSVPILREGSCFWDEKSKLTMNLGFGPERQLVFVDEVIYLSKNLRISRSAESRKLTVFVRSNE